MCHAASAGRNVTSPPPGSMKPFPENRKNNFKSSITRRIDGIICWERFVAASRQLRRSAFGPLQSEQLL
jgi:hypothetical protein